MQGIVDHLTERLNMVCAAAYYRWPVEDTSSPEPTYYLYAGDVTATGKTLAEALHNLAKRLGEQSLEGTHETADQYAEVTNPSGAG
jgi:hypothetical protein